MTSDDVTSQPAPLREGQTASQGDILLAARLTQAEATQLMTLLNGLPWTQYPWGEALYVALERPLDRINIHRRRFTLMHGEERVETDLALREDR